MTEPSLTRLDPPAGPRAVIREVGEVPVVLLGHSMLARVSAWNDVAVESALAQLG